MLEITIPGKPVPLNNAYSNGFRGKRFMVKRAVDYKKMIAQLMIGKKLDFDEKTQFIEVDIIFYGTNVLTKSGSVSKTSGDVDGKIKLIVDAIFSSLGINDAFICAMTVSKVASKQDESHVTIRTHSLS